MVNRTGVIDGESLQMHPRGRKWLDGTGAVVSVWRGSASGCSLEVNEYASLVKELAKAEPVVAAWTVVETVIQLFVGVLLAWLVGRGWSFAWTAGMCLSAFGLASVAMSVVRQSWLVENARAEVLIRTLLRGGRCGSCGYRMTKALDATEPVVGCPECGAAWASGSVGSG